MALNIQVKKVVTLNIDIDQDGLEKLVRDEIARKDPNIKVNSVNFKATRNPTGIAVEVDAEYDENQSKKSSEPTNRSVDKEEDVKADVCKTCGEEPCECAASEEKQETPVEEQLELEEASDEEAASESFEDAEMALIDETLAEEEEAFDDDIPDAVEDNLDEVEDLPDGMEDLPDLDGEVETEPKKRKSLFDK